MKRKIALNKVFLTIFVIGAISMQASEHPAKYICLEPSSTPTPECPVKRLGIPPQRRERYGEMLTQYNEQLPPLWNGLTPQERIFAYYVMRASIPGNRIYADQLHRNAVETIDIFKRIIAHKETITQSSAIPFVDQFLKEAELFSAYLFANHSQYFMRDSEDNKRTPNRLHLSLLTPKNIERALDATGVPDAHEKLTYLHRSLFDAHYEPTLTVEGGKIEECAVNLYGPNFTDADFAKLTPEQKTSINSFFYLDPTDETRTPKQIKYKIGGRYSPELRTAHHWLSKAYNHTKYYTQTFDPHIPASLGHMLNFLQSGDEEDFKKFSIEWLKTKSRIDFNFGFVEVYQDPKQARGSFEADVTIKAVDTEKLNKLFPTLEKQLPFPQEYMRQNLDDPSAIPNSSVNVKIFASGEAGPVTSYIAYCLPNYLDIKAQHGSKQITYQLGHDAAMKTPLARRLFASKEYADWFDHHDPHFTLEEDIESVLTTLHETLGHGSGRLAHHIFAQGDPLTIEGQQYKMGDVIQVTDKNIREFVGSHDSMLEELRAEIIALYTSTANFDALAANGFYKDWPHKIGKEKLIEQCIRGMALTGILRLIGQKEGATKMVDAHPQANNAILNYLVDHGGVTIITEKFPVHTKEHTVIDVRVHSLSAALRAIKDLAMKVQHIKSTANVEELNNLIERYAITIRHPEFIQMLKENRQAIRGNVKEFIEMYPRLTPVTDAQGTIKDISAEWPENFLEQQLELSRLEL